MPLALSTAVKLVHPRLVESWQTNLETLLGSDAELGETIAIRRDSTTLPDQDVRIVPGDLGRSGSRNSPGADQDELAVFVVGVATMDIAVGDRFNDSDDLLYEVSFIRPNRQIWTVAEARIVQ